MGYVKENREKRIAELEKRVEMLEVSAKQANNMKDAAERQCKSMQSQFDDFTQTIETQKEKIEKLEEDVVQERSRVSGNEQYVRPSSKVG